jgi:hypothetical protein
MIGVTELKIDRILVGMLCEPNYKIARKIIYQPHPVLMTDEESKKSTLEKGITGESENDAYSMETYSDL